MEGFVIDGPCGIPYLSFMAAIAAEGRIPLIEGRYEFCPLAFCLAVGGNQGAIEAASAELDHFMVPMTRQIDLEFNIRRLCIDGFNAAADGIIVSGFRRVWIFRNIGYRLNDGAFRRQGQGRRFDGLRIRSFQWGTAALILAAVCRAAVTGTGCAARTVDPIPSVNSRADVTAAAL